MCQHRRSVRRKGPACARRNCRTEHVTVEISQPASRPAGRCQLACPPSARGRAANGREPGRRPQAAQRDPTKPGCSAQHHPAKGKSPANYLGGRRMPSLNPAHELTRASGGISSRAGSERNSASAETAQRSTITSIFGAGAAGGKELFEHLAPWQRGTHGACDPSLVSEGNCSSPAGACPIWAECDPTIT